MADDGWALFAVTAFWLWIVVTVQFIFKAFPKKDVFQPRQAMVWGGASIICACCWIIALRLT